MLNIIALMGILTAEPELRHTPNGVATCTFRIEMCIRDRRKVGRNQAERRAAKQKAHHTHPELLQPKAKQAVDKRNNQASKACRGGCAGEIHKVQPFLCACPPLGQSRPFLISREKDAPFQRLAIHHGGISPGKVVPHPRRRAPHR